MVIKKVTSPPTRATPVLCIIYVQIYRPFVKPWLDAVGFAKGLFLSARKLVSTKRAAEPLFYVQGRKMEHEA